MKRFVACCSLSLNLTVSLAQNPAECIWWLLWILKQSSAKIIVTYHRNQLNMAFWLPVDTRLGLYCFCQASLWRGEVPLRHSGRFPPGLCWIKSCADGAAAQISTETAIQSLDRCMGKFTGPPPYFIGKTWKTSWCPVDFPSNQSKDSHFLLGPTLDTRNHRVWRRADGPLKSVVRGYH